jgi:hypothetical protein
VNNYQARCGACDRTFQLCAASLRVVRWKGAHPGREWQVHGFCPGCDDRILCHEVKHPTTARALEHAGAAKTTFEWDAELDDPLRVGIRRPITEAVDVAAAEVLMGDDARFARALEIMAERYGS